ncbi:MAG TPA: AMP-binding protein [Gaiellaceae bacterium]|jgi:acyl-CoA synthetase (AMP-forming)/AMP-acid ligase II|nr:AMP-binding protein [Gaiellaceae bacterium]
MSAAAGLRDTVTSEERRRLYEAEGFWDETSLPMRVRSLAERRGGDPAVVDLAGARSTSYEALERDSNRVARFLLQAGVQAGDVVGVQLPNWYETVAVDLGVLKAGAIVNPMLTLYRAKELRQMLSAGSAKVLFTPRSYRGFDHVALVEEIRPDLPSLLEHVAIEEPEPGSTGFLDLLAAYDDGELPKPRQASAVSELIFTSGTEAEPKAIMHTEQTTNYMARATWDALGLGEHDVVWMPSPIGHSTGLNFGVRVALYHGLLLVLQDRWSKSDAARLVEEWRCSYTLAATTFLSDLVDEAASCGRDLSSMRLFGSGGAPVPEQLVRAGEERGIGALRLYGSTELLIGTWNRAESPPAKRVATDGIAFPNVEIDVRNEDGESVRNEPGEIFGRSPGACVGFFADPERTSATFSPDGWIRSGDLGLLDDDGYLTIVGRRKEIIIRGGLNIAPREIEDLILREPEVAAVAVVGLADERLGEITCACIVLREGCELHLPELVARLEAAGLATYKLPQALAFLDALPATPTGKIKKHEIVAALDMQTLETTGGVGAGAKR